MEFEPFGKIPRLFRGMTITEKLDGTNAQVSVIELNRVLEEPDGQLVTHEGRVYLVRAGSRSRYITPGKHTDNHGFAAWVYDNASELVYLGPGRHFGEWWGSGINRGYGLKNGEKRFSLFNTSKWSDPDVRPECCDVVPVLYEGGFNSIRVQSVLWQLENQGSAASPGFMRPEGVVVYHHAANKYFKATIENDEEPKGKKEN